MGDSVIDDLYGDLDEIHENAKLETVSLRLLLATYLNFFHFYYKSFVK